MEHYLPFGFRFAGIKVFLHRSLMSSYGCMPYRDGWEIKGLLTHYGFAFAQWLFGRHMWSIRVLDLPFLRGGMLALGFIVSRITSSLGAYLAAIVFRLWIASLTWRHKVQPDT